MWSHKDVEDTYAWVRDKAAAGHNLLITASRAVLQHGTEEEVGGGCYKKNKHTGLCWASLQVTTTAAR